MRYCLFILCGMFFYSHGAKSDSWSRAQEEKSANLDLYWFTSSPFIFKNSKGELTGLEYEMITAFGAYLDAEEGIDLQLHWHEAESFSSILDEVRSSSHKNIMGVSAFSITEERQQYLNYTNAYLPDITVLVSSEGTPIVRKFDEIHQVMQDMEAITIKGTVYEKFLKDLRKQLNIDFEIIYIDSDQNVLEHISQSNQMFGFIDLPVYLIWIKSGKKLTRQNFFTVRGIGYGFIMPKESDWHEPFNQFLSHPVYKNQIEEIISKYLGDELYQFIEESFDEQLGTYILTKEKEIQLALVENANLKLAEEISYKRMLLIVVGVALLFLMVVVLLLYKNRRTTKLIVIQKDHIQWQQENIHRKNEQLMNRNAQLMQLNEDKNNLVNILAHDLRAPLGHIMGLTEIMNSVPDGMTEENKEYLYKIDDAAHRMDRMIAKILDIGNLERNKNQVHKEQLRVKPIIQDLLSRYETPAKAKDIDLQVIQENEWLEMETDHMLLFLVLENLVSNAIKFSSANTTVTIRVTDKKDHVLFVVSDQGPGFTDEDKAMIFNQYQKLSAQPTGNESSTGLGLSIVKKYVKDLEGEVWLESEQGAGSSFYVSLPN